MSLEDLRLEDFLSHMIEAIDRIEAYTRGKSEDDFAASQLIQDAVLRNFAVLGEAAKNVLTVAPEFARKATGVPFAKIYGMRNQLEHGYFTVDVGIVWNVIAYELPKLRPELEAMLNDVSGTSGAGL
jgi:uncharacterized protein with HEPN domain